MNPQPPKLAERFLLFFLKGNLAEEVLGDLDEKFYSVIQKKSPWKAKLNYWYQVFNYLRPFAFKHLRTNSTIGTMFKHNFLISYRVLLKNKTFSAINIGGLSLGMTVVILIGLWIYDELSFNKNHENYDSIVQVLRKDYEDGILEVNSSLVSKLGVHLRETYPTLFKQVTTTFYRNQELVVTVGKQSLERQCYFFTPEAPEIFTLEMASGQRNGLDDRYNIMLSESLANTLFLDENPIGKFVKINTSTEMVVTGVYKDLPLNSTFGDMDFILSMDLIYNDESPATWSNFNTKIYAQLNEGIDINEAAAIIKDELTNNRPEGDAPQDLVLSPMKDWHLRATSAFGVQDENKRLQFIRLYGAIGIFVLILACINFMNLNTARCQGRAKEIGVRKSIGSQRHQLISQFFAESVLYALASYLLTLLMVFLVLPWFNEISDKDMHVPWGSPWFWLVGGLFILFSALLAGSYPAVYLSSFGPVKALKGSLKQGVASVRFRKSMVVFQFTISIALMIGTITVYKQLIHAKSRPVGYNQEDLISLRGRGSEFYEKFDVLRAELKRTGMVKEVASANYPLTNTLGNNGGFGLLGTDIKYKFSFNTIFVNPEYGKATEWEIVAGRDFSRDGASEESSIIISEYAAEMMGLEDPVGKQLSSAGELRGTPSTLTIIGVVKDMIKGSPFEPPSPLMLFATEEAESFAFIRLVPKVNYIEAIPRIQEAFEKVIPGYPFHYEFVDDSYQAKFRAEERIGSLASFFSIIAVFISCLGLFGLSAFMVEQRTKEIGIRKVLGASVSTLWRMLSKDFTVLVIISCLIAMPIAGYFLSAWLEDYSYRIDIYWWIYAIAGVLGFGIALLTISYHSLKASMSNPVNTLRSE